MRSDVIHTYDFSGALAMGGSVSGQFTIDFTTTIITDFSFSTPNGPYDASNYDGSISLYTPAVNPNIDEVSLLFPAKTGFTFLRLPFEASFDEASFPGTFGVGQIELVDGVFADSRLGCSGGSCAGKPIVVRGFSEGSATLVTVAEPATLGLLGVGLAGIGFARRRTKKPVSSDRSS